MIFWKLGIAWNLNEQMHPFQKEHEKICLHFITDTFWLEHQAGVQPNNGYQNQWHSEQI